MGRENERLMKPTPTITEEREREKEEIKENINIEPLAVTEIECHLVSL